LQKVFALYALPEYYAAYCRALLLSLVGHADLERVIATQKKKADQRQERTARLA
jgi:hypothetical protein